MNFPSCTYEFWFARKELKYSTAGVERSVAPRATIRRARAVLDTIGVTKVADVTGLDRAGIPNFISVRPDDLGPGISYYNGKGMTRADARAGALMEAIERHAGEHYDGPIIRSSFVQSERTGILALTRAMSSSRWFAIMMSTHLSNGSPGWTFSAVRKRLCR